MARSQVFSSVEVRWFLDGPVAANRHLLDWFESVGPGISPPAWRGRIDGQPDVYLLLPDAEDMGIKWREGLLQIKGRSAVLGRQEFGARHLGFVESWLKWSYEGLPAPYRSLFADGTESGVPRCAARKNRALRLLDLGAPGAASVEVPGDTILGRGMAVELTDLDVEGRKFCSLGFEAFPDDDRMRREFAEAVGRFLGDLEDPVLGAGQSMSYPSMFCRIRGRQSDDT